MKPTKDSIAAKSVAGTGSSESATDGKLLLERYFGTGVHFESKDGEKGRQAYKIPRKPGRAEVLGVYPVKAEEPCHLVEVMVTGATEGLEIGDFTQAMDDRSVPFWQVPWMEVLLDPNGTPVISTSNRIDREPELLRGYVRLAFFFHYLDKAVPLLTPFGDLSIPGPTKRPTRLKTLKYEVP